jgi:hypothetical protein
MRSLVIDEQVAAGGQVYRAVAPHRQRRCRRRSPARVARGEREACVSRIALWNVERDDEAFACSPRARGARRGARTLDRRRRRAGALRAFRGWELPGVMGLQRHDPLKSQRCSRPQVRGRGAVPLLYAVRTASSRRRRVAARRRRAAAQRMVDARPPVADPILLPRHVVARTLRTRACRYCARAWSTPVAREGDGLRATWAGRADRVRRRLLRLRAHAGHRRDAACWARRMRSTRARRWHVVVDDEQRCDVPASMRQATSRAFRGAAAAPARAHRGAALSRRSAVGSTRERDGALALRRAMTARAASRATT